MDYRKFLAKDETLTLPWLGGASVDAQERRLRLSQRPTEQGWYSFTVKGRTATPGAKCEPPDLSTLPKVRGWLLGNRLVSENAKSELVHLMPEEEPPRFSPALARRWYSGELLFDALDFESEVEGAVREALAKGESLTQVKGAAAPLRAAYGYAMLEAASRAMNIPFAPGEVRHHVADVANGGRPAAEAVLRVLEVEREQTRRELAELERRRQEQLVRQELEANREARQRHQADATTRAMEALESAGAHFESARHLGREQLEVVFGFMDHRFISVVNAHTLQVIDSGICLGHPPRDDLITLDSLPSVIKEAIDTDALVILRWP